MLKLLDLFHQILFEKETHTQIQFSPSALDPLEE